MFFSTAFAAETGAHHAAPFYATAEFWVAAAFVIVVGLAAKPVFRALAAALDERSAKIAQKIDEAEALHAEAKELLATYQKKQRDALAEAEEILARAKEESLRLSQQAAADLDVVLKRREQQALDRIAQAEASASADVQNRVVDLAIAAARHTLSEGVQPKASDALIDNTIKALGKALH
jgi:F-type H+-transporting ATPase subunit b